jgi:hypothetical protein
MCARASAVLPYYYKSTNTDTCSCASASAVTRSGTRYAPLQLHETDSLLLLLHALLLQLHALGYLCEFLCLGIALVRKCLCCLLLALLVQKYEYWHALSLSYLCVLSVTCITSTKVQLLTRAERQLPLRASLPRPCARARVPLLS